MNVNKLVVGLLFLGSIGIGFAQGVRGMGGGGISGQPIDGTTIKPKSIQVSGTADQFVCTSTTATCEVESSIDAATMTSTVPAFDIGPTATPGTDDRLACFSYGPTGSKTRVACVDKEGDMLANALRLGTSTEGPRLHVLSNNNGDAVTSFNNNHFLIGLDSLSGASSGSIFAQYDATNNRGTIGVLSPGTAWRSLRLRALDWNFIAPDNSSAHTFAANGNQTSLGAISGVSHNSTAASGNQAFTCTNTGCRSSLGSTARYFYDTGTSLASISNFNVGGTMQVGSTADATPGRLQVSGTAVGNVLFGVSCQSLGTSDNCFYIAGPTVTGNQTVGDFTANATGGVTVRLTNQKDNNGSALSKFEAVTSTANGGDPQYTMTISGVDNWSIGIDNSDSDKFKLSRSDRLGTNDLYTVTTGGDMTVTGGIKSNSTVSRGTISLSGGTGTATVLSGAVCVCSRTDAEAAVQCAVASTTLTATSGASTGTVAYVCL